MSFTIKDLVGCIEGKKGGKYSLMFLCNSSRDCWRLHFALRDPVALIYFPIKRWEHE